MSKKSNRRNRKSVASDLLEKVLPQNILAIGDHVEENKNIYISQPIYREIHRFTKNKTTNESGGMLVGKVIEEFGKTNIVISGFVEAKYCEATPTTLKFTHETWEFVHKEVEKKHQGKKIVGWIHTHPDFGIFLSEYDKFIHQNFFNDDYQVAYVVDPIQHIEGFYFWINEKLERCNGFYIYDKTGKEITVDTENKMVEEDRSKHYDVRNIVMTILSVAVVFLMFSNISTNNKLEKIESRQMSIVNSANQSLAYLQQEMWSQSAEIQALTDALKEAGIIVEQTEQNKPDADDANECNEGYNDQPEKTTDNNTSDDDTNNADVTTDAEQAGNVNEGELDE